MKTAFFGGLPLPSVDYDMPATFLPLPRRSWINPGLSSFLFLFLLHLCRLVGSRSQHQGRRHWDKHNRMSPTKPNLFEVANSRWLFEWSSHGTYEEWLLLSPKTLPKSRIFSFRKSCDVTARVIWKPFLAPKLGLKRGWSRVAPKVFFFLLPRRLFWNTVAGALEEEVQQPQNFFFPPPKPGYKASKNPSSSTHPRKTLQQQRQKSF